MATFLSLISDIENKNYDIIYFGSCLQKRLKVNSESEKIIFILMSTHNVKGRKDAEKHGAKEE